MCCSLWGHNELDMTEWLNWTDDTVHKNPEDAIRKLLELIKGFGKFSGCKVNTQKSFPFLYVNNEGSEREI